jgi:predicted dehydrogenase
VPWRGKWATETGGTTMIHGIHEIDLMLWLLGDWREVRAMMGTLDRNIEVDDVMMGIVQLENNAMVSIVNSALSPREETYLRLDFQKVTVELLHLYGYSNSNWKYTLPASSPDAEQLAAWEQIPDDYPTSQSAQLVPFLDAMDRGERPPVSGADVRRTMEFLTALYKAAITGQPVQRGSISPGDPFYYAMNGAPQRQHDGVSE